MPTQAEWHAALERRMPPPTSLVARNRAITAAYARWHLQEPWLFKWAGMAAFASAQAGIAAALAEMLMAPDRALRTDPIPPPEASLLDLTLDLAGRGVTLALLAPTALHDEATAQLLADLMIIKQANDAIFADAGWVHFAYIHGGIAALEACLDEDRRPLLDAFRLLEEGVQHLCRSNDHQTGLALIDQGSIALLRREQMHILPPYLERLSELGRRLASLGAWLDFEGTPGLIGQPSFSAYYGLPAVLAGTRSVANTADRWQWIERDVLPKWSRADKSVVHRRLQALADEQPTMLQLTAGVLNTIYPALRLQLAAPAAAPQT